MTLSSWLTAGAMQSSQPSAWPDGLGAGRALIALLAVFGLLVAFLWLLRHGQLGGIVRKRPGGITVETAVPLGERRSLVVVSVEGRRLLLGVAPGQVSLVAELRGAPDFSAALDDQVAGHSGRVA